MLASLPSALVLCFSLLLALTNTAFFTLIIVMAALCKLLPITPWQRQATRAANAAMAGWLAGNSLLLNLCNRIDWQVQDHSQLNPQGWHLIISNHQSWTDIVMLGHLFRGRLPVPKFFLKYELLFVPFIGLACWGLDMPFMRRYSPAKLLKQPQLRGKDIATTQAACAKFRHTPTTIINFVEGTRFTPEKRLSQRSGYQHLMPPKAAGLAMALHAMDGQFDKLLNVTLHYPDNPDTPFRDLLCGRMGRIQVLIEEIPMSQVPQGNYQADKQFKREFQNWLNGVWSHKDAQLAHWQAPSSPSTAASSASCISE